MNTKINKKHCNTYLYFHLVATVRNILIQYLYNTALGDNFNIIILIEANIITQQKMKSL